MEKENINIKDKVSITSNLNPSVIRDEFELYRSKLNTNSKPGEFIVTYIILQVYIENHFHYYLRFLIGGGFTSGEKRDCWKETSHAPEKIKCFRKILTGNQIKFNNELFKSILDNYKTLTDVRNALAHGHPITRMCTDNSTEESEARKLLTHDSFSQIIKSTNSMINNWNLLMDELLAQEEQCKAAKLPQGRFVEHCKFKTSL